MIRILFLLLSIGTLAACELYQEPRANCFSFAQTAQGSDDCTFTPLPGSRLIGLRDE